MERISGCNSPMRPTHWAKLFWLPALASLAYPQAPAPAPQASYVDASHSTLRLQVDGKEYLVDVAAGTVHPAGTAEQDGGQPAQSGATLFAQHCAGCHGTDGRGISSAGTPNFTSRDFQAHLTDQQISETIHNGKPNGMPAFGTQFDNQQIAALTAYIRSFSAPSSTSSNIASNSTPAPNPGIYEPGDDVLFTLPTGRPVDEHAVIVNFTHRFAYDSAVSGTSRGAELFGLDNFALSSFGVRYGVTDKLSVDVWRSPSFIGRPIQLMAAYHVMDEHHEDPFNLTFRVSIEGQDNFKKNYTENIETIISRSITSRMQFYFVPTASFNDRKLVQGSLVSDEIPDEPGVNAFSLGTGISIDIRPTVALIAEVIPTVVGGAELGVHRPPFSFAIQKKLYRHAFTFGFTTSPGTTVSQRAGTNATFLNQPGADEFGGLFLGFDITRRIY
jgi:mono/diheme cytochrome c family protein